MLESEVCVFVTGYSVVIAIMIVAIHYISGDDICK
jgi:hypothetical protein